jgi:hypothetical protein
MYSAMHVISVQPQLRYVQFSSVQFSASIRGLRPDTQTFSELPFVFTELQLMMQAAASNLKTITSDRAV